MRVFREIKDAVSAFLHSVTEALVPDGHHLAKIYPFALSLILFNLELFFEITVFSGGWIAAIAGVITGSTLLILNGWIVNDSRLTRQGAAIAGVGWIVAAMHVLIAIDNIPWTLLASYVFLYGGIANVGIGLWWVLGSRRVHK